MKESSVGRKSSVKEVLRLKEVFHLILFTIEVQILKKGQYGHITEIGRAIKSAQKEGTQACAVNRLVTNQHQQPFFPEAWRREKGCYKRREAHTNKKAGMKYFLTVI